MKKRFSLLCAVLTALIFVQATNNASFNWSMVNTGTASSDDYVYDVVTDATGNIFLATAIKKTSTFNGVQMTANMSSTTFNNSLNISKISPNKTTLWTIYSNDGIVLPTAMATTPTGDLIVTGTIRALTNSTNQTYTANLIDAAGTITSFSGLNLSSSYYQSFVAKFNSNGVLQWVKEFDSSASKDKQVLISALAADASGNVYMTANYTSAIILPGTTPVTLSSTNTTQAAVVAKLDGTTGNVVWTKASSGAIRSETLSGLVYGEDGYLYASGVYRNVSTPVSITVGDKTLTPSVGYDLILIRLDTDGNISYIQDRPNTKETLVKDLTVKNGKVFVGGYFVSGTGAGIIIPGGTTFATTSAYKNGCVLAFNSADGTDLWQRAVVSALGEVNGVAVGSDGNLYAFGNHYNAYASTVSIDFGSGFTFENSANTMGDLFLSSYNVSTGVTQEAHLVAKGSNNDQAISLTSFGSNLYMCGNYNSTSLVFENSSTSATSGGYDFLLVDYTVTNPSTGIVSNETAKSPIVYTDKANHQLVLTNANEVKLIALYDATGRIIKTATNNSSNLIISTQGIIGGVYVVKLTTSSGNISSQRVIIY